MTKPINIGVPQGSILGPLFFLIYINDLSNAINSRPTPRLFADDTCLILRQSFLSALEKACSDELIQLKDWCDTNKIQINPNKSCILHLSPKQNTPPLTFQIPYDNSFIVNSICCKYLGILIDNKLNFKQHIQLVESKIAKSVGILNKLRHIFPSSAPLLLIYFALVHPHLPYGLPIWGSTFPTYFQKLQRLQNKALCIISNCNPKASTTPLFYQYKILKIQDLYYFEIMQKLCTNTPINTFQSALHSSLPKPVQFIIGLLDPIFETIYTYHTSYRLDARPSITSRPGIDARWRR